MYCGTWNTTIIAVGERNYYECRFLLLYKYLDIREYSLISRKYSRLQRGCWPVYFNCALLVSDGVHVELYIGEKQIILFAAKVISFASTSCKTRCENNIHLWTPFSCDTYVDVNRSSAQMCYKSCRDVAALNETISNIYDLRVSTWWNIYKVAECYIT